MEEKASDAITGTVEEVLPNSLFRVRMPVKAGQREGATGELLLAYLAGKMKLHRIRVLLGDQVELVLDPYGGRARIVRRLS
ncbi:MAG: translation initiation factor translation initiation factor [Parcubacteria group bacterium]|nr:translation initiation factor translation initiation factor [Parcubacteria group bacterium]